jgi:tetratricopeptide (TPR) repeat protein
VVEEIITALSRMRWLLVIARNSSFIYKGRAVDVKEVGRELGVRYVLEGSVRKATGRLRVAGQLIDASTGAHIWADRFDGALDDIFDLQDQITASVVGAIAPTLERAEIERAKRKPTESLDAYDCFLRGLALVNLDSREASDEGLRLFYRAMELDPDFASAYGKAAWCYARRKANGWVRDREQEIAESVQLARRAVRLGKDDAVALYCAGFALAYVAGELDDGAAFVDRALAIDPNLAAAWCLAGWTRIWFGEHEAAIKQLAHGRRLSPLDAFCNHLAHAGTAHAHFFAGRYDEASRWAGVALRERPESQAGFRIAAASNALAGRLEEAKRAVARLRVLDPGLRLSSLTHAMGPYRRPEDIARYAEGLRKAGLPE